MVSLHTPLIRFVYQRILKPFFFRRDPEDVHDRMVQLGAWLGRSSFFRAFTRCVFAYTHPLLEQRIQGITFSNPIGLAAGFDKNAQLISIIPAVGFGWMEIGSITAQPCAGNPKPRLWRLPASHSLAVYYGLKNDGADTLHTRLLRTHHSIPLGISIAKTNCEATVDTQRGIDDYAYTYALFHNIGDYYTINISCPNTFGGQPFTDADRLTQLLQKIQTLPHTKPVFIKLSPDLSLDQLDVLVDIALAHGVTGFICTNLTKHPDASLLKDTVQYSGGLSGKVVEAQATAFLKHLYPRVHEQAILIGCGGVFTAEDAYAKIRAGASLIQLVTGMIYQGPQAIGEINRGLVRLLQQDGFSHISEAVGVDTKVHPKLPSSTKHRIL